jgi:hypothetical protein
MFDEVQSEAFCFLNPDFNKECDVYIFSDIPAFSLALFNVAIDAAKNLEVIPLIFKILVMPIFLLISNPIQIKKFNSVLFKKTISTHLLYSTSDIIIRMKESQIQVVLMSSIHKTLTHPHINIQ